MMSAVKVMGGDIGQFQMDAALQPGNSGGFFSTRMETSLE